MGLFTRLLGQETETLVSNVGDGLVLGPDPAVEDAIAVVRQSPPPALSALTQTLGDDVPYVSLRSANLAGFHARASDFERCCTEGANFAAANITINTAGKVVDLTSVNLMGAMVESHQGSFRMNNCNAQGLTCRGEFAQFHMEHVDACTLDARGVNVAEFDARHTNMQGARLDGTTLALGSCVSYCDLSQASLREVNACGVNFTGCNFSGADLTGIKFDETTVLNGCDLSGVKGITPAQLRAQGVNLDLVAPGCIIVGPDGQERFADASLAQMVQVDQHVQSTHMAVAEVKKHYECHALAVSSAQQVATQPEAGVSDDLAACIMGGGFKEAAIMSYAHAGSSAAPAQVSADVLSECGRQIHQQMAGATTADTVSAADDIAMQGTTRNPEHIRAAADGFVRSLS